MNMSMERNASIKNLELNYLTKTARNMLLVTNTVQTVPLRRSSI